MQIRENTSWGTNHTVRADQEWVRLLDWARRGDHTAEDRLANHVLEYAKRRVRILGVSADDTPDVAQACTVEVLRHLGDFDANKGRFDGWVSGFALNSVRAYNRGARKLRAEVALEDVPEPTVDDGLASSKRAGLETALGKLTARDKNLLSLRFGMGLSSEEISAQVNMSPTQVRKRISRAIERLRRQPAIQDIISG